MVPVPESEWRAKADPVREELFRDCKARGGVISGEHGIGLVKKPYLSLVLDERQIELMRGIKRVFDPNGHHESGKNLRLTPARGGFWLAKRRFARLDESCYEYLMRGEKSLEWTGGHA